MPVAIRSTGGTLETCANFVPTEIDLQQMDSQATISVWLPMVLALVGLTLTVQKRRTN